MGYYPWLAVESSKIITNITKIEPEKVVKLKYLKNWRISEKNIWLHNKKIIRER